MRFLGTFDKILVMDLKATIREKFGKDNNAMRKTGYLPAELYGRGVQNMHLSLALKDLKKVYKLAGENTVVNVVVDAKRVPVLIYNVQRDYITDELAHADLYAVRMDEKLQAKVPFEFFGESGAVKNFGGVLVKAVQEITVEALPDKIPHTIRIDLSKLVEIGNSIHLNQLNIADDVKVLIDMNTVVVTVKAKMTEEQEAALAAAGNLETVKVETEEKKLERDTKKAAETPVEGAPVTKPTAK